MPTNVLMPQLGESIAEGTIVRWNKQVGDKVDRDEPLFEISTDKVDAEIPSLSAGVVTEIRVREGETVPVNSVVAVIGLIGETPSSMPPSAEPEPTVGLSQSAQPEQPVLQSPRPGGRSPSVRAFHRSSAGWPVSTT